MTRLLPALAWEVHPEYMLIGTCDTDPGRGGAEFDAWADLLADEREPDRSDDFGRITFLRATVPPERGNWPSLLDGTVLIQADLLPPAGDHRPGGDDSRQSA
jgi:hypothetical protein